MEIKKTAVLGAGTMGPTVTQVYAGGGYDVVMYTRRAETLESAKKILNMNLNTFVEEGVITAGQKTEALSHVTYTLDLAEAAEGADYIEESIVEDPDAKRAIYAEIDALAKAEAIIASNTSFLNIFPLVPERRQKNTVIAHFVNPAHIMPLVEVVRGGETADETMDAVVDLHEKCGKTPARLDRYISGFIFNRLQQTLNREVFPLIDNGYITPEELDKVAKVCLMPRGMLLGLCQRIDFNGLDISVKIIKNGEYSPFPEDPCPKTLFEHYEKGELGIKTGKGFYDYRGRDKSELLLQRDRLLLKSVKLAREFLKNRF